MLLSASTIANFTFNDPDVEGLAKNDNLLTLSMQIAKLDLCVRRQ